MDPRTLETYRQRLLALQQQLVQRIFDTEDTMLAMDADRDIERTDRVQEEAAGGGAHRPRRAGAAGDGGDRGRAGPYRCWHLWDLRHLWRDDQCGAPDGHAHGTPLCLMSGTPRTPQHTCVEERKDGTACRSPAHRFADRGYGCITTEQLPIMDMGEEELCQPMNIIADRVIRPLPW